MAITSDEGARAPLIKNLGEEDGAGLTEDDVLFFSAHIELDVEHAEGIKESLLPFAQSEDHQELMRFGAIDFLDARCVLWDGLERASFQ